MFQIIYVYIENTEMEADYFIGSMRFFYIAYHIYIKC